MKKLLLMFAVVGVLFTACNKECGHEFIEHDFSKDIVGTWTCLEDGGLAEAMVIKEDGSFAITGVAKGGYLYEEKGSIKVVNNKVTLAYNSGDVFEGRLEFVAGKSMSLVMFDDNDVRLTYDYCETDLSDEIVGLWVATDGPYMSVEKFTEDGKAFYTGYVPESEEMVANSETVYEVIGDLQFHSVAVNGEEPIYVAHRLVYIPNYTSKLGDVMTWQTKEGISFSRLRIKQNLDLVNNSYDYNNIYVTNVKAKDAEFEFAGQTLNLATMDGRILDKMMKNLLFNVSFPSANEIVYNYHYNGENIPMPAPIVVDGNKMTIKKSVNNPACKDIDVWTFQDQNNTQMHMYMPVTSFENFLANTAVEMLANEGKLDLNDAAAVKAIFDEVEAAIETINVSFIFKAAK